MIDRMKTDKRRKKSYSRDIFAVKPNSTNTAMKFYDPLCERVEKLNYFQPNISNIITKQEKRDINHTMKNFRESIILREEDLKTMQKFSKLEFPHLFSMQYQIGKNQSQSLQKIEHISNENKLNNKRKFYEEMMKEKKEEKNKLVKDLNRLNKEKDDLEAELEFLNNFDQFASLDEQTKTRGINKDMKKSRLIDEENFLILKRLKFAHEKRNTELDSKYKCMNNIQENLNEKRVKLKKVEDDLNDFKSELEKVKDSLILHYHRILNEGTDTRQEGLTWVIREILLLGDSVMLSYLPTFLDEQCISYLFKLANLHIDIIKLQKEKMKYKHELKEKYEENILKKFKHRNTFRTAVVLPEHFITKSRENSSTEDRTMIQKYKEETSIFDDDKIFTMKSIDKFIGNKSMLDKETIKIIDIIGDYDKQEKNLREVCDRLKSAEMNRLFREFVLNDYEKRFGTTKNVVISAMIGEDHMNGELLRQAREEKIFYDKLKKCRNFNFLETRQSSADKFYAEVDNILSKRC